MDRFVCIIGVYYRLDSIKAYYFLGNDTLICELDNGKNLVFKRKTQQELRCLEDHLSGRNHIVQIMDAPPGLQLKFRDEDGNTISWRPLCFALTASGEIRYMDVDSDGMIDFADECANFEGVCADWWDCNE